MMRLSLFLMLGLLSACAGPRVQWERTSSPATVQLVLTLPAGPGVGVEADDFARVMPWLARDVSRPSPGRVVRASFTSPERDPELIHGPEVLRDYSKWCAEQRAPGDCLAALGGRPTLTMDGKRSLALALSLWPIWDGLVDELGGMANMASLMEMVNGALLGYLLLWLTPDGYTQVAAAVMTGLLAIYLASELMDMVQAWVEMTDEVAVATTFEQIREASVHFGGRIGQKTARLLVMAAMALLGSQGKLPPKLQQLPGFKVAAARLGLSPEVMAEAVAATRSAQVAEGRLTLALPSGALAMAAAKHGGLDREGAAPRAGPADDPSRSSNPGSGLNGADNAEKTSGSTTNQRIEDLLKPDGRWIGDKGSNVGIRTLKGGVDEAQRLFDQLSAGGTRVTNSSYKGTMARLPGDGTVGLRTVSKSGPPTIDINVPGLKIREIKFVP